MPPGRSRFESPLGPLDLSIEDGVLVDLSLVADDRGPRGAPDARVPGSRAEAARRALLEAARAGAAPARGAIADRIAAYFGGALDALDEIPVAPRGTEFQRRVWLALRSIPPGQTRSYGQIAAEVASPAAVRAVGAANGANPIPLVLPCHRVIASSGALHGYGWGLWRKEWLLRHEGYLPPAQPELPGLSRGGT